MNIWRLQMKDYLLFCSGITRLYRKCSLLARYAVSPKLGKTSAVKYVYDLIETYSDMHVLQNTQNTMSIIKIINIYICLQ